MKEKRNLNITNKVFKKNDFLNLANILSREQQVSQNAKHRCTLTFAVHCKDNTSYESESITLFDDGGVLDTKQITSLGINFLDYTDERHATVSLVPGDKYVWGNRCDVSGTDANWVE